jgi:hypothetical protein
MWVAGSHSLYLQSKCKPAFDQLIFQIRPLKPGVKRFHNASVQYRVEHQ